MAGGVDDLEPDLGDLEDPADLLTTADLVRAGREADDGVRDHVIGRL
jgi:hypothetical protein